MPSPFALEHRLLIPGELVRVRHDYSLSLYGPRHRLTIPAQTMAQVVSVSPDLPPCYGIACDGLPDLVIYVCDEAIDPVD
jgi:hypothetical protein